MSETEILKPSQKTVELDTDGYEDKDVVVQESKKENEISRALRANAKSSTRANEKQEKISKKSEWKFGLFFDVYFFVEFFFKRL